MKEVMIGFSIGIIIMRLIDWWFIYKSNITIQMLYYECGMASENIKYNDHQTFHNLQNVMLYAERRHRKLKFVETYNPREKKK